MLKTTTLAACLVLCAAPAIAQSKADVQKLGDGFAAAFNKGDAAAVAARYTSDAYVLPDHMDMVQGRAAIEGLMKKEIEQVGDLKITVVDVQPLGPNAAREVGTYTLKTKGQASQQDSGKYATVLRKVGGQWLIATDIWNSNK
jgi:uncharacterized protein (TIGR02246 family)